MRFIATLLILGVAALPPAHAAERFVGLVTTSCSRQYGCLDQDGHVEAGDRIECILLDPKRPSGCSLDFAPPGFHINLEPGQKMTVKESGTVTLICTGGIESKCNIERKRDEPDTPDSGSGK